MGRTLFQLLRDLCGVAIWASTSIQDASWRIARRLYGSWPICYHHVCTYQIPPRSTLTTQKSHGPLSTSRATQVQESTCPLGSTHQSTRDRVQRRPQRIRHHSPRHGSYVQHLQPRLLTDGRIITMQEDQNVWSKTTEWHFGVR